MSESIQNLVEKAFDYRGDVTIRLQDESVVEGFVFNREHRGSRRIQEPYLELMLKDGTPNRLIKYSEIVGIDFTGEDTAAGKSWEEWQAKEDSRKKAAPQTA